MITHVTKNEPPVQVDQVWEVTEWRAFPGRVTGFAFDVVLTLRRFIDDEQRHCCELVTEFDILRYEGSAQDMRGRFDHEVDQLEALRMAPLTLKEPLAVEILHRWSGEASRQQENFIETLEEMLTRSLRVSSTPPEPDHSFVDAIEVLSGEGLLEEFYLLPTLHLDPLRGRPQARWCSPTVGASSKFDTYGEWLNWATALNMSRLSFHDFDRLLKWVAKRREAGLGLPTR